MAKLYVSCFAMAESRTCEGGGFGGGLGGDEYEAPGEAGLGWVATGLLEDGGGLDAVGEEDE